MSRRAFVAWLMLLLAFWALLRFAHDPATKLTRKNADQASEPGPELTPAIDLLASFLTKFDNKERELAIVALGKIGKPAIPALEKLLIHEDEMTRQSAVWALSLVGKPAKGAGPALIKVLTDDPDPEVRTKAAEALTQIMSDDPEVLKTFARHLHDNKVSWDTRYAIAKQLRHWGEPAIPILAEALRADIAPDEVQGSLAYLLSKHKTKFATEAMRSCVVEIFSKAWGSPFEEYGAMQRSSLWNSKGMSYVLATLGDAIFKPLERPLHGKDLAERRRAALALARMAHTLVRHCAAPELADRIVMQLVPFCQHEDLKLRKLVLENIPYTKTSDIALRTALTDEDGDVRGAAHRTLTRFNAENRSPLFQLPLAKKLEEVRIAAMRATMFHDQGAQITLRGYLAHEDAALRHFAAYTIGANLPMLAISGEDIKKLVVPILADSLKSDDPVKRRQAAQGMARSSGFLDAVYVPLLLGVLNDKDSVTRESALYALRPHNSDERADILEVVKLFLKDHDWHVRWAAVECLARSPNSNFKDLVDAYVAEKEIWNIKEAILKFLEQQDDQRSMEMLLEFAAKKDGWPIFSLLRMGSKKTFPHILDLWCKQDAKIRDTIDELPDRPKTLNEAALGLAELLKRDDLTNHRRVAYTARRVIHYLEYFESSDWLLPMEKAIERSLAKAKPMLQAKDSATRRDAVMLLWEINATQTAIFLATRQDSANHKVTSDIQKAISNALNLGCSDPDLSIRRLSRKALRSELPPDNAGM